MFYSLDSICEFASEVLSISKSGDNGRRSGRICPWVLACLPFADGGFTASNVGVEVIDCKIPNQNEMQIETGTLQELEVKKDDIPLLPCFFFLSQSRV